MDLGNEIQQQQYLQNFIRLSLLLDFGAEILRKIFRIRYYQLTQSEWKDNEECGKYLSQKLRNSFETLKFSKIQKEMVENGDLDSWDLATLATILRLDRRKVDLMNDQVMKMENMNIKQLNSAANSYSHLSSRYVTDATFGELWTLAATALMGLGATLDDFDEILQKCEILNPPSISPPQYGPKLRQEENKQEFHLCPQCSNKIVHQAQAQVQTSNNGTHGNKFGGTTQKRIKSAGDRNSFDQKNDDSIISHNYFEDDNQLDHYTIVRRQATPKEQPIKKKRAPVVHSADPKLNNTSIVPKEKLNQIAEVDNMDGIRYGAKVERVPKASNMAARNVDNSINGKIEQRNMNDKQIVPEATTKNMNSNIDLTSNGYNGGKMEHRNDKQIVPAATTTRNMNPNMDSTSNGYNGGKMEHRNDKQIVPSITRNMISNAEISNGGGKINHRNDEQIVPSTRNGVSNAEMSNGYGGKVDHHRNLTSNVEMLNGYGAKVDYHRNEKQVVVSTKNLNQQQQIEHGVMSNGYGKVDHRNDKQMVVSTQNNLTSNQEPVGMSNGYGGKVDRYDKQLITHARNAPAHAHPTSYVDPSTMSNGYGGRFEKNEKKIVSRNAGSNMDVKSMSNSMSNGTSNNYYMGKMERNENERHMVTTTSNTVKTSNFETIKMEKSSSITKSAPNSNVKAKVITRRTTAVLKEGSRYTAAMMTTNVNSNNGGQNGGQNKILPSLPKNGQNGGGKIGAPKRKTVIASYNVGKFGPKSGNKMATQQQHQIQMSKIPIMQQNMDGRGGAQTPGNYDQGHSHSRHGMAGRRSVSPWD